jgi:hypothetical protein
MADDLQVYNCRIADTSYVLPIILFNSTHYRTALTKKMRVTTKRKNKRTKATCTITPQI